ncbi:MAG: alanine racemase [Candidatus Omnitrophota bacterium]
MKEMTAKTKNGVTHPRYRSTWAEIDLKAIAHNYKQVKRLVGKEIKVMAVVKANAYGHGTVEVSKVLESLRVDYLGVATMDEAVRLRDHGIKAPILVLGSVLPDEVRAAAEKDITLTLASDELLNAIRTEVRG